jgi:hypothetical protein
MTPPPAKTKPRKRPRTSDLRGAAQLATHATVGVTHIAEGVHQSVWSTLGFPGGNAQGQTGGITGLVYSSVRGVARLVGKGIDATLARLQPLLDTAESHLPGTPQRESILAALNGVVGHHLAATHNPLAIRMSVRYRGEPLDWQALPPMPDVTGKVLLLIHGLCMSDLHWHAEHEGRVVDHGDALASALGYTPLYLRYNTGLHVSQNGRELSAMLEALVAHWPVPIEELTVVVHSMGGLVIRSACECAKQDALRWPARLKSLVFLGTPHHGAPLERAGNRVDVLLGSTPWTAPFARLGHLRSAGITDLRYGHVVDEDWQGHNRFHRKPDGRRSVPLPEGVACYAVAATLAARRGPLADRLLGDGLVPLPSALGRHDDPHRTLAFPKTSRWIVYRTSHLGLLSSPAVSRQIVHWLAARPVPGTTPVPGGPTRPA